VFRRFKIENFDEMRRLVKEYVEFYNTKIYGGIVYRIPKEKYLELC